MRNQSLWILGASLGLAMAPAIAQDELAKKLMVPGPSGHVYMGGQDISTQVLVKATVMPACKFTSEGGGKQVLDFGEVNKARPSAGMWEAKAKAFVTYQCSAGLKYRLRVGDGAMGTLARSQDPGSGIFETHLKNQKGDVLPVRIGYVREGSNNEYRGLNDAKKEGMNDGSTTIGFTGSLRTIDIDRAPPGQYMGHFTVTVSPLGFSRERPDRRVYFNSGAADAS